VSIATRGFPAGTAGVFAGAVLALALFFGVAGLALFGGAAVAGTANARRQTIEAMLRFIDEFSFGNE
jgi:hypothetical protein